MTQDVSVNFVDGALAVPSVFTSKSDVNLSVGVCSGGAANTFYAFTDPKTLKSFLGSGPLVEKMAFEIDETGIAYGVKVTSTPAATPTFAQSGSGPAITITGNPKDAYQMKLAIVQGGARGTATFKISFDGGDTYSEEITTAATVASFATETGLTFAFAVGTYVVEEVYSATCAAESYSSGNLIAALEVGLSDPRRFKSVHIVGTTATAADLITLATAVSTALETHATNGDRFVRAIMEHPDVSDAAIQAAQAGIVLPRIMTVAGYCEAYSVISRRWYKRSLAWAIAARVARRPVHERIGRVATGPITPKIRNLYRDERVTPGAKAFRCASLLTREIQTVLSIYGGPAITLAAPGSDYARFERALVIDLAASLFVEIASKYIDEHELEINPDQTLTAAQAKKINLYISGKMRQVMVNSMGACLGVSCAVSTTEPVGTSEIMKGQIRVFGRGYVSGISFDVGFAPPELSVVAA